MLDIYDLETRHKRYKLRSFVPYFAIFVAMFMIFTTIFIFLFYDFEDITQNNHTTQQPIDRVATPQEIVIKTDLSTPQIDPHSANEEAKTQTKEDKVTIPASLNSIDNIKSQTPSMEEKSLDIAPKERSKIDIKKQESDNIADLIKRFNTTHNPSLGLFIAKKYYQAQQYKQAYNYALMTNKIDSNIEESWILFSKSLIKIDKKDEAIKTLKKYIEHSNSSQAKQLLDEISTGKFQ